MAILTNSNVLPIENARPASRRRVVTHESVGVLNDCRDMALKRIVTLFASTLATIEVELFEMAEKANDRETQNLYCEARAQAHDNRGAIEAAFKKQFLGFLTRKWRATSTLPRENRSTIRQ